MGEVIDAPWRNEFVKMVRKAMHCWGMGVVMEGWGVVG